MGQGLPFPAPGMVPWTNLFALPPWTGDEAFVDLAANWYLDGYSPVDAVEIPFSWLSGPMRFRQDRPFNYAAVSSDGGGTAIARTVADEQVEFTTTLGSRNDVNAPNLAHFTITYYDEPRTRLSSVALVLNDRTEEEIWKILGVGIGDRITITDPPTGYPRGADNLVVEGVRHNAAGNASARVVVWATSPVIGAEIGEVGPFFRVGVSPLDSETDLLPW